MNASRKSKGLHRIVLVCLLVAGSILVTACSMKSTPGAQQGVLDLRDWQFGADGIIGLNGEWMFYWQQFPSTTQAMTDPVYLTVPSSWTHQDITTTYPSSGYGTYKLRVQVADDAATEYALKIPEAQTALRLYVNGSLIARQGTPGSNTQTTHPAWKPQVVFLPSPDENGEFLITVEVANFAHRKGGLDEPFLLGTQTQIQRLREANLLAAFVAFGSLVTIGIYHLSLNVTGARDKQAWWFSLLCFSVAARIWVTDEIFLSVLTPGLPWVWYPRLDYSLITIAVIAFAWYYRTLFPALIPESIVRIIAGLSLAYTVFVLIAPSMWFTHVLAWYHYFYVLCIIYYLIMTLKAVQDDLPHAVVSLIGFLAVGVLVINDILLNNEIIHTMYLSPYGIVLFVFIQAYVQASRFSVGFRRKEALSHELEQRVQERTVELNTSLSRLRNANEMLEISQAEAISARENAEQTLEAALASTHAKTEFMANVSHQLRTPMNAILGFTEMMLMTGPPESAVAADVWMDNLRAIQRSSGQLSDLIENVLLMTESETGQLGYHPVVCDIWLMFEELGQQFSQAAQQKGLVLRVDHASNVPQYVRTDSIKLHRVLKELLTNAIKFTSQGHVQLSVKARRSLPFYLILEVSDTGPGFSPGEQSAVFDTFRIVSKGDVYKQGLGLGLPLCRRLVRVLGGELSYVTQESHGTVFRFQIPVEVATSQEYAAVSDMRGRSQFNTGTMKPSEPRRLRGASLYVQGRNIQLPAEESLPEGWLVRITDALADLNTNQIVNLIYEIRNTHRDYADMLLALVEKNDYDTIKALVGTDQPG